MSFIRRLSFYFVGVGIGLLFVLLFFGPERTYQFFLGWLPKAEIKKEVARRTFIPTEDTLLLNQLACYGIDEHIIYESIQEGQIDLSKSETRKTPKKYLFRIDHQEIPLAIMVAYEDSVHLKLETINEVVPEGAQALKDCP